MRWLLCWALTSCVVPAPRAAPGCVRDTLAASTDRAGLVTVEEAAAVIATFVPERVEWQEPPLPGEEASSVDVHLALDTGASTVVEWSGYKCPAYGRAVSIPVVAGVRVAGGALAADPATALVVFEPSLASVYWSDADRQQLKLRVRSAAWREAILADLDAAGMAATAHLKLSLTGTLAGTEIHVGANSPDFSHGIWKGDIRTEGDSADPE